MLRTVMYSDEQRIVYDVVFCEKLRILTKNLHDSLLVFVANFKNVILVKEVAIL